MAVGRHGSWAGKRGVRENGMGKIKIHSLKAAFESLGAPSLCISIFSYFHALHSASQFYFINSLLHMDLFQSMHECLSAWQQTQTPCPGSISFSKEIPLQNSLPPLLLYNPKLMHKLSKTSLYCFFLS